MASGLSLPHGLLEQVKRGVGHGTRKRARMTSVYPHLCMRIRAPVAVCLGQTFINIVRTATRPLCFADSAYEWRGMEVHATVKLVRHTSELAWDFINIEMNYY